MDQIGKINASRFYFEYKGHRIEDITAFQRITVAQRPKQPIVYLAGDSSLDNKYWLPSSSSPDGESLPVAVPEIYKTALQQPYPKADVAFWLNHFLGSRATAINLAVEASLIRERDGKLLEHDEFIRDHIKSDDILIVSVGANDIAMNPTRTTILYMLLLAWLTPLTSIQKGTAWGIRHFVRMFKDQVENYISSMIETCKPKAVIICMIYYPFEAQNPRQESWANHALRFLGYNRFPHRLQAVINTMYEHATKQVCIPGVEVIPFPLFTVLDGKDESDYVARVEPSIEGGRKMASQLADILKPLIRSD